MCISKIKIKQFFKKTCIIKRVFKVYAKKGRWIFTPKYKGLKIVVQYKSQFNHDACKKKNSPAKLLTN